MFLKGENSVTLINHAQTHDERHSFSGLHHHVSISHVLSEQRSPRRFQNFKNLEEMMRPSVETKTVSKIIIVRCRDCGHFFFFKFEENQSQDALQETFFESDQRQTRVREFQKYYARYLTFHSHKSIQYKVILSSLSSYIIHSLKNDYLTYLSLELRIFDSQPSNS